MSQIPIKFISEVGQANGLATLDGSAKIPSSQLPSTVLQYEGLWNPSINTPTLQDSTGTNGFVYQVSMAFAGPILGLNSPTMVNFQVGNIVIFSSAVGEWQQADSLTGVTSVNGAMGAVTVNAINQLTGDVTAGPASQSQSKASTVAAIQGTTVSGTTGTGNVVFSASPTLSGSVNISSLSASQAVVTDGSKNLTSMIYTPGVTNSSIVSRDSAGNSSFNNAVIGVTTTVTAGQTISMNFGSSGQQRVTGSSNITFNLPDATTLTNGETYAFSNLSTGTITIFANDGVTSITTVLAGGFALITCTNNSTVNGTWDSHKLLANGSVSGTVGTTLPGFISGNTLVSTVATGTSPIVVASTTLVPNLYVAQAALADNTTATSNSTITTLSALSLPYSQITGAPAAITALTGDATASGPGSAALTLATVNTNTGTFGSGSVVPVITVNGKGLITAVSTAAVVASAAYNIVSKTTTYAANINDYILASSSAFTVTLPTAVGVSGQSIVLKKTDSSLANIITVNTTSAQTIDGLASGVVMANTQFESYVFTSDGANWQITDHKTNTPMTNAGVIAFSATSAYVFTWTGNQSIVIGDTYSDGSGHIFTVSATTNTTTGTFSGTGTPATTGTLTRVTGTGVTPITWTSRTITGAPAFGTTASNAVTWYRQGSNAIINYLVNQTTAGNSGSGDYLFYMPAGMTINTTFITPYLLSTGSYLGAVGAAQSSQLTGFGNLGQSTSAVESLGNNALFFTYSNTAFRTSIFFDSAGGLGAVAFSSGSLPLSTTNAWSSFTITVPIQGWQP